MLVATCRSRRRSRRLRERRGDRDALVFASRKGTPLHYSNMRRRILRPAIEEAGASWAGFHTFRHSVRVDALRARRNAVQVQRWLGHHSPAFTLSTYVHLLDAGVGEALDLKVEYLQPEPEATALRVVAAA